MFILYFWNYLIAVNIDATSSLINTLSNELPPLAKHCHGFSDTLVQPVFAGISEFVVNLYTDYVLKKVLKSNKKETVPYNDTITDRECLIPLDHVAPFSFTTSNDKRETPTR